MTKTIALIGTIALVAGVAFSVPPAYATEDLSVKIAGAKTAADHEALAAEFEKEAQEAEANAAAHEKMAASYKGLGTTGAYHADKHCAALASGYHTQAKQLKELAAAEHAAAKAAK
jgi:hypothetical protein